MRKYFYGLLPVCLLILVMTGCNDTETIISIGETRNLVAEMSTQSAAIGDKVVFTVKIDQQNNSLALDEDIDVTLTFAGKDVNQKEVSASDIFDGFTGHIALRKGEQQGFAEFTVKENLADYPVSGTITAYVRGYQINAAERPIVVSDRHYTIMSLKNNSDNTVKEYGYFVLLATVGAPAKEDVKVFIAPGSGEGDKFSNLPEYLIVKAGYQTAESDPVRIEGQQGTNDFESVSLSFSTDSETHPLYGNKLDIKVTDIDGGLDEATKMYDERWVYIDPDQVFVSATNEKAVEKWDATRYASALEIKEGDPHPNESLAAQGWMFLNSYEFHPISALTQGGAEEPNEYGNRPPRFMAAQNVANTQKVQAVVNEKYSTMTQEGYLRMWCARDPGLATTGGVTGTRDYGVSAFYASKFDGVPTGADSWEANNVRILPGTRVEVRIRIRGKKHSFNTAVWFQGNIRNVQWSTYGEVDLLENPANKKGGSVGGLNNAWQTFHWNDKTISENADKYRPTSGSIGISDMDDFDIYWMEWRDNNEIVLGINGKENLCIKRDGSFTGSLGGSRWNSSTHWPFEDGYNPEGMHLLLTFAGCNEWALDNNLAEDWADDFKNISYQDSKTSNDTPRMEIDWIRFYKKSNYGYYGNGAPSRNKPMY